MNFATYGETIVGSFDISTQKKEYILRLSSLPNIDSTKLWIITLMAFKQVCYIICTKNKIHDELKQKLHMDNTNAI
jgi:hypothetical protein